MQGVHCVDSCSASTVRSGALQSCSALRTFLPRFGASFASAMLVVSCLSLSGCSSTDTQTSGADATSSLTTIQSIAEMVPDEVAERNVLRVNLGSLPQELDDSDNSQSGSEKNTASDNSTTDGSTDASADDADSEDDTDSVSDSTIPHDFDKSLINALATIMGLDTALITTLPSDSALNDLGTKADLVIGNLSAETNLTENTYTVTYLQTGSQFVVNSSQTDFSVQDPCGSTIGVLADSTQQNLVDDLSRRCELEDNESIQIQTFADFAELSTGLADSQVDAVLVDVSDQKELQTQPENSSNNSDYTFTPVGDLQDLLDYVIVTGEDPQMTVAVQAAVQYLLDIDYIQYLLDKYDVSATTPENSQIRKQ